MSDQPINPRKLTRAELLDLAGDVDPRDIEQHQDPTNADDTDQTTEEA